VADRNSDPDHSFDLALRRPARLKHTLNQISASRQSSGGRLCAVVSTPKQAIVGSLKSIELVERSKARARIAGSYAVNAPDEMAAHHAVS
jgi:hypothetical protein